MKVLMSGVMILVIVVLHINFCRMGEEEGEAGAFTVIELCPHPQRGEQMHHLPRTVFSHCGLLVHGYTILLCQDSIAP